MGIQEFVWYTKMEPQKWNTIPYTLAKTAVGVALHLPF